MEDGISHEAEKLVVTNFLHFRPDTFEDQGQNDMNAIDHNHICIDTIITEDKELLVLCVDIRAPKSIIEQEEYEPNT